MGAKQQSANLARWPARATIAMRQGAQPLHEGSAAARNPTHRSPAACQGRPCLRASLPAHNLITTPHAHLQVISSCGPRGLCDPPSVTTMDKTFSAPAAAPLAAAYRKTQKETAATLYNFFRVFPYLIQRHEGR